jgi:hypothetical protein
LGVFAGLVVGGGTGGAEDEKPAPGAPAVVAPAEATGATAAPGSPAEAPGSAAETESAGGVAVVSFEVRPRRAHIFVNGAELAGSSTDIPLAGGSASIEVVVRARGYRTHSKVYSVTRDQKIEVDLRRDRRGEPSGPGGLLDIR